MTTPPDEVFAVVPQKSPWLAALGIGLLLLAAAAWWWNSQSSAATHAAAASASAERRTFKNVLRRQGFILPFKEERIFSKLAGTIQDLAAEGSMVVKDDVVLKLDSVPHEDLLHDEEQTIAEQLATYQKLRVASLKTLNLAREDVNSFELRLQLEKLRLDEIKKGPTPTDEINAEVNLENNKTLLKAKQEETEAIVYLAKLNYASKEEARQKELDVTEQQLKVVGMDIALRKLNIIDPVKVAEQDLKVKEAIKTRDAAAEKVVILDKALARDEARYSLRKEREDAHLKVLKENIAKTSYLAPCSGVVVPRKAFYGFRFAPGREVFDGMEILTIPDLSRMKVKLTVDEGRVGNVALGMSAALVPAGWTGQPFMGKISHISEQGRDEFEQFTEDTTAISGTANRKVFEVEVELQDHSSVLRMGLRCDVEIILGQIENAIVIPRAALLKQQDGEINVRVRDDLGAIQRRKIKLKSESDLWAAVDGVAEGERVLLAESKTE